MRGKVEVLKTILDSGIIAIIRAPDADRGYNLAEAAFRGGITAIEITMTVPAALEVIRELGKKYSNEEITIGAGTVLDSETARLAILAGAEYVVSPYLNLEVVRICHRYGKVCMPGAMTIKEVAEVMESGAQAIKLFPANLFGPSIIKTIMGPLPHAVLIPTGGINLDNVTEWLESGAAAVGVGGDLTKEALNSGDYGSMERKARDYLNQVRNIRDKLGRV